MTTTKLDTRIDIAARALVGTFRGWNKKHPDERVIKAVLIPMIARRANSLMEDLDATLIEEEAITVDEKFIWNRWKEIRLQAAEVYKFYVCWDSNGVYVGTFEEYEKIPEEKLKPIAVGLMDSIEDMSTVIVSQGGQSIVMTWSERLLTSGGSPNAQIE